MPAPAQAAAPAGPRPNAAAPAESRPPRPPAPHARSEAKRLAVEEELARLRIRRAELSAEEKAPAAEAEAEREYTALRPLTAEEQQLVDRVFGGGDPGEKFVTHEFRGAAAAAAEPQPAAPAHSALSLLPSDLALPRRPPAAFGYIEITRRILECMRERQWLNDEVINFYLGLIQERAFAEGRPKAPRVHVHNTFFYNKLFKDRGAYEYKNVARWTTEKKLGYCILDCDLILVPVHQEYHWVLAAIDLVNGTLSYYDSLHGQDRTCLVRRGARALRTDLCRPSCAISRRRM